MADSANTKKLLDSLDLTRREEGLLRHIASLGYPEPRGRLGRLFNRPLHGLIELLAALVFVVALACSVAYLVWKVPPFILNLLDRIDLPLIILLYFIFGRSYERLIRKLYRALEARTSTESDAGR